MFPIPSYYFGGNVSLSGRQFQTHTRPHGLNKNSQKVSGERNNYRGIIVLFFFAFILRFFILTICIIQSNEAQRGGLTGIVLAVMPWRHGDKFFTWLDYLWWPGHNKSRDLMFAVGFVLAGTPLFVQDKIVYWVIVFFLTITRPTTTAEHNQFSYHRHFWWFLLLHSYCWTLTLH